MGSRLMKHDRITLVGVLVTLALVGCSSAMARPNLTPDPRLASVPLADALPGYVLDSTGSGPMAIDAAASSTSVDSGTTRNALSGSSFNGGYSRVWTSGDSFVAIVVFAFDHAVDAGRFEEQEVGWLSSVGTVYLAPESKIPGGHVYVLSGKTKARPRQGFCDGGWVCSGDLAVDVRS